MPGCDGGYIWEGIELKKRERDFFSFIWHHIIWSKYIILVVQMSIK